MDLLDEPALIERLVQTANDEFNAKQPDLREALAATRQKIEGASRRLDRVTDALLEARTSDERQMWIEKSQRLQREKLSLEKEFEEVQKRVGDSGPGLLTAKDLTAALSRLKGVFGDLPVSGISPSNLGLT